MSFHGPSSNLNHEVIGDLSEEDLISQITDSGVLSDEDERHDHTGNYSTRMDELFEDEGGHEENGDEEDEEEGFLYTGVDSSDISGYQDRLRDVLEDETDDEDVELQPFAVGEPEIYDNGHEPLPQADSHTPSISSMGPMTPPSRMLSPAMSESQFKLARPFLHPNVSRLRSYTPQGSPLPSNGTGFMSRSRLFDGISSSPSHFSSISRVSSTSNFQLPSSSDQRELGLVLHSERDVFKWTELHSIMLDIYSKQPQKAAALLGTPSIGSPTVLAANGYICVGADDGKVYVYDFKQVLKCVCGTPTETNPGPVTALALSHDHTFIASGHATGQIQLFDLKHPQSAVRYVLPTTLAVVSSGRKEGHLRGSRIVSVGFVAGRHTALVSADEHGLAFFHTLGKILFVEASDILRILGRYPDDKDAIEAAQSVPASSESITFPNAGFRAQRRRGRYTILAMAPLPLGTVPHTTDAYNVVALLTPTKLVVVGLKPTPRTWFKCPREVDEGGSWRTKSKWRGTLAWYPSVLPSPTASADSASHSKDIETVTLPMLVYTWGHVLHIIKVSESKNMRGMRNNKTGKTSEVEIGSIAYTHVGKWRAEGDILAIQWLNANQIVIVTEKMLGIFDIQTFSLIERTNFEGLSLVSSALTSMATGDVSSIDSGDEVAHSVRVYKGKIFLLGRTHMQVGTLLTWADRILSFVQAGDFLSAIDLTILYYLGRAPGNRNGLPADPLQQKEVVGQKLRELMVASTRYAFSEERMTDGTHETPDGRGVDRTPLFEGLVTVCCRACIALNDFEFLFEDLFQQYDDVGISSLFLQRLEPFILDNDIRYIPPRITQKLIALHAGSGRLDYVERIIWHIDPDCLDIHQAIHLCQANHLYDALIYVHTRALRDYVAPVVELLGLMRRVQQLRRSTHFSDEFPNESLELIILNAYKIYPYLANILSGLTYPSEEPLPETEAFQAKNDIYKFLFFGRSSVWPPGEGAKLVLTSDEEGGVEPTYPYVRQLLRFDSESFLHSLDIAFEDSHLNDELDDESDNHHLNAESGGINRLIIVRILMEILSSGSLSSEDVTLVNIFIARNVPKYPQYLELNPSALHNILVGLAEDHDFKTREDRQLATEYLLSVYNPHESERIVDLFESAGFYRILRSWYRQEQRWTALLSTFLDDPDVQNFELLDKVDEVLEAAGRRNKGKIPTEIIVKVSTCLPQLLDTNVSRTAVTIDQYFPELHQSAIQAFGDGFEADQNRFLYLCRLLGPSSIEDEEYLTFQKPLDSSHLPSQLRQLYITLQCRYRPREAIKVLQHLSAEILDWQQVLQTCEAAEVFDAVIWARNWQGQPREALKQAEAFQRRLALRIVSVSTQPESTQHVTDVQRDVDLLEAIGTIGIDICLEHSQGQATTEVPLEDIWFQLLSSQINCVQILSESLESDGTQNPGEHERMEKYKYLSLHPLRSLVQKTFGALVTITSTRSVSFPRLFTRLVNSAPTSTGTHYTEFRTILTGMLESYRSEGDILVMTKHLVDRDLYETFASLTRERGRGWTISRHKCSRCKKSLHHNHTFLSVSPTQPSSRITISRNGTVYHDDCHP